MFINSRVDMDLLGKTLTEVLLESREMTDGNRLKGCG